MVTTSIFVAILCVATVAYLLGSIPFGLLIGKAAGLGDIRNIGSGNIGATNVLRTGRKELAVLTLLGDAVKGIIAVFFAKYFFGTMPMVPAIAALFAIIGHCFPVWLGFKGGKGVATAMGVTFALSLWLGLIAALVWLIMAAVFRTSSLAALTAMAAVAVGGFVFLPMSAAVFVAAYCVLIVAKHHENIARLLSGDEPKIGSGK